MILPINAPFSYQDFGKHLPIYLQPQSALGNHYSEYQATKFRQCKKASLREIFEDSQPYEHSAVLLPLPMVPMNSVDFCGTCMALQWHFQNIGIFHRPRMNSFRRALSIHFTLWKCVRKTLLSIRSGSGFNVFSPDDRLVLCPCVKVSNELKCKNRTIYVQIFTSKLKSICKSIKVFLCS